MSQKKKKITIEGFRQYTLQRVQRDIQRQGYSVILVEGPPAFGYTIGFAPDAPELFAMGLNHAALSALFQTINVRRNLGTVYSPGQAYQGICVGFPCYLAAVEQQYYQEWLKVANYYHRSTDYPCWQVVWPDPEGKFPWEEGFNHLYGRTQQLLFTPPGATDQ